MGAGSDKNGGNFGQMSYFGSDKSNRRRPSACVRRRTLMPRSAHNSVQNFRSPIPGILSSYSSPKSFEDHAADPKGPLASKFVSSSGIF